MDFSPQIYFPDTTTRRHADAPFMTTAGANCGDKVNIMIYNMYINVMMTLSNRNIFRLFRYWPFLWGIHRSLVNSPHKGQWRGVLMLSLICARINGWVNNREAGDLGRHRAHYDVIVMWRGPQEIWHLLLFCKRNLGCSIHKLWEFPGIRNKNIWLWLCIWYFQKSWIR